MIANIKIYGNRIDAFERVMARAWESSREQHECLHVACVRLHDRQGHFLYGCTHRVPVRHRPHILALDFRPASFRAIG